MKLKELVLQNAIKVLTSMVTEEVAKEAVDKALDVIEDAVNKSSTPYDNMVVLPVINVFRKALNVPDNE